MPSNGQFVKILCKDLNNQVASGKLLIAENYFTTTTKKGAYYERSDLRYPV
jgi:hypothetical protein